MKKKNMVKDIIPSALKNKIGFPKKNVFVPSLKKIFSRDYRKDYVEDYRNYAEHHAFSQVVSLLIANAILVVYSIIGFFFLSDAFHGEKSVGRLEYGILFCLTVVLLLASLVILLITRKRKQSVDKVNRRIVMILSFFSTLLLIGWSLVALYYSIHEQESADLMTMIIIFAVISVVFTYPITQYLTLIVLGSGGAALILALTGTLGKTFSSRDGWNILLFLLIIVLTYFVRHYSTVIAYRNRTIALQAVSSFNEELEIEVREKTHHIQEMHDRLIVAMADMVEGRDPNTGGHIKRTSYVVSILAQEIAKDEAFASTLREDFLDDLIKAAPMHDLGKIAVDDAILRKPGKFTPEEFAVMKTHAAKGAEIVHRILSGDEDNVLFAEVAENVAHYHHERWDGSGYPDGKKGEEIPLEARIMAVADVYDALVSRRCYKDSFSFEKANAIMKEGMGSQFDPALERYYDASREKLEQYYLSEGQNGK